VTGRGTRGDKKCRHARSLLSGRTFTVTITTVTITVTIITVTITVTDITVTAPA